MAHDIYSTLVYARRTPVLGKFVYYTLKFLGIEIPLSVSIGSGLELAHGGFGVVIHSRCKIGDNVKIYPGVTIGRADIYRPMSESLFDGIVIENNVVLCPGCKILCKSGVMVVSQGTVVGANAVLLSSTEKNEIWAGIPARCVGKR